MREGAKGWGGGAVLLLLPSLLVLPVHPKRGEGGGSSCFSLAYLYYQSTPKVLPSPSLSSTTQTLATKLRPGGRDGGGRGWWPGPYCYGHQKRTSPRCRQVKGSQRDRSSVCSISLHHHHQPPSTSSNKLLSSCWLTVLKRFRGCRCATMPWVHLVLNRLAQIRF